MENPRTGVWEGQTWPAVERRWDGDSEEESGDLGHGMGSLFVGAGRQPEETFQKDPGVGGVRGSFWERILWFVE